MATGPVASGSAGAAGAPLGISRAAASLSMTTSSEPTGTFSPTAPWIETTVPATGAGLSTIALSVVTSTSVWSSSTRWPTATCHFAISASAVPSPTSGNLKT
jgi:hypothetical protein